MDVFVFFEPPVTYKPGYKQTCESAAVRWGIRGSDGGTCGMRHVKEKKRKEDAEI